MEFARVMNTADEKDLKKNRVGQMRYETDRDIGSGIVVSKKISSDGSKVKYSGYLEFGMELL